MRCVRVTNSDLNSWRGRAPKKPVMPPRLDPLETTVNGQDLPTLAFALPTCRQAIRRVRKAFPKSPVKIAIGGQAALQNSNAFRTIAVDYFARSTFDVMRLARTGRQFREVSSAHTGILKWKIGCHVSGNSQNSKTALSSIILLMTSFGKIS